jgi:hypothetical protein
MREHDRLTGSQGNKVEHGPGVIIHVTDQGATSPDPVPCDLDREPSSALGGGSSTRSNTRPTLHSTEDPSLRSARRAREPFSRPARLPAKMKVSVES